MCSAFSFNQNDPTLRLGSLSRDPLADIWIAIRQGNTGRFALSEKMDAVLTRQSHILKVKDDSALFSFRGDERFQFGNVLPVDPAA
jgi:hypothetical protein